MARKLKTKGPLRTLGVYPGAREMGYAVLEEGELVYFGVHTFKHRQPRRFLVTDGVKVVGELINACKPQLVAIEKASAARSTRAPRLTVVIDKMKRAAHGHGRDVKTYPLGMIKEASTGSRAATRRDVADAMVMKYPFLTKYRETDELSGEKYWVNMLNAVAVARTGFHDMSGRQ